MQEKDKFVIDIDPDLPDFKFVSQKRLHNNSQAACN